MYKELVDHWQKVDDKRLANTRTLSSWRDLPFFSSPWSVVRKDHPRCTDLVFNPLMRCSQTIFQLLAISKEQEFFFGPVRKLPDRLSCFQRCHRRRRHFGSSLGSHQTKPIDNNYSRTCRFKNISRLSMIINSAENQFRTPKVRACNLPSYLISWCSRYAFPIRAPVSI